MKAQKQTNPDIVKVSIIAHINEWTELIDLLDNEADDSSALNAFYSILNQIINNDQTEWTEYTKPASD